MRLEQIYTLRQEYLARIKYKSDFTHFNKNMGFKCIGKYIDKEPSETTSENISLDINSLHKQLDYIVYLSNLSYYYIANSGILYRNLLADRQLSISRINKLGELLTQSQTSFNDNLQAFIQKLSQEDKKAENLIYNEITYLKTASISEPSTLASIANQFIQIDIDAIKAKSKKDYIQLTHLFENYKCQWSAKMQTTNIPKNNPIEEENKPTDSGNCSDDDSELSDYQDAMESLEEENQAIPQTKGNDIVEDLEVRDEPTMHTEPQEQNASNKNNLLTRLWDLLIKTWQYIKNIFKLFEKNDDLNNTNIVRPSYPTLQQSTFEENIPPIAAETKKPQPTPIRITNVPQTLFADKKPTVKSEQKNASVAEWVTAHLPKFGMLN